MKEFYSLNIDIEFVTIDVKLYKNTVRTDSFKYCTTFYKQ